MYKAEEGEQAEYIAYQHVGTSEMLEESVGDGLVDVDDSVLDSSDYTYEKIETEFVGPDSGKRRYRMRVRAPAAVHYCDKCDKSFKYPSKIQEHMRKHTGEKPFNCTTCGAKFSQSHVLKAHMRSHQGEKPFKCSYCDRCFATMSHRNQHEKVSHNVHFQPERQMTRAKGGEIDESLDQLIFECPYEECGHRSFNRVEVEEHIALEHSYENSHLEQQDHQLWAEYPVQEGAEMLDQEYGVYLEDELAGQPIETHIEEAGSSQVLEAPNASSIHEIEVETSLPGYQLQEMKKEVLEDYPHLERDDHYEPEEEIYVADVFEEATVQVEVDPNPPKRGKKQMAPMPSRPVVMEMDLRTVQNLQPRDMVPKGSKRRTKEPRNLDWVIDAVAKGLDVSESSPHNRKKPQTHTCHICGKVNKYPSKILAHMRTHTKEKPFKCEICGMQFSQRTPMRLHLRRHLNQKPFRCEVEGCGESFVSGALKNQHYSKKHLKEKKYVCIKGCGRYFASMKNQRSHEIKCDYNKNMEDDPVYQQLVYDDESDDYDAESAPHAEDSDKNWGELMEEEGLDSTTPLVETDGYIDHEEEYIESA